jgi:hypothetical protein
MNPTPPHDCRIHSFVFTFTPENKAPRRVSFMGTAHAGIQHAVVVARTLARRLGISPLAISVDVAIAA